MKKTNVVIIMADQLRYDVFEQGFTPNIDALSNESVVFNRAYCACPLCVPARGAFFTGKYPNETGSLINPWDPIDAEHGNVKKGTTNLYSLMENDWDSYHVGKQHFITEEKIDKQVDTKTKWTYTEIDYKKYLKENGKRAPGGIYFRGSVPEMVQGKYTKIKKYSIPTIGCYEEGFDYYYDGYFLKGAIEAIQNRDKSQPFLLNAMFLAPHPPFDVPEPWFSKPINGIVPENVGIWCDKQSPLQLYNLTGALGIRYDREDWEEIWPYYLRLVHLLDYCVGVIIKELKEEGIYEDTLLIFTSDHGEMLGSHNLWQKMCMYEESSRIPLSIKFPHHEFSKKNINHLVSAIDVLPTLCDYLDVEVGTRFSGKSLMPLIRGDQLDRNEIFIQFDGNGARGNFQRCIIQDNYKLIVDIFKDEYYIELYNVMEDPQEFNNLAFDPIYRDQIQNLLDKIKVHMKETGDLLVLPENIYEEFFDNYMK